MPAGVVAGDVPPAGDDVLRALVRTEARHSGVGGVRRWRGHRVLRTVSSSYTTTRTRRDTPEGGTTPLRLRKLERVAHFYFKDLEARRAYLAAQN